jgi:hypothetical protein
MVSFEKEYELSLTLIRIWPPRQYQDLATTRDNLSFLPGHSRWTVFEVNKNKIYWGEDKKTTIRADSMQELKGEWDEEAQQRQESVSCSSLKDIYGASEGIKST